MSTLPAAAAFEMPAWLLDGANGPSQPAVLDAVYKPPLTALVRQAAAAGCPVVPGATMLLEQGLEQSQLWTGRLAPAGPMRRALLANVLRPADGQAPGEAAEVEAFFRSLPDWAGSFGD